MSVLNDCLRNIIGLSETICNCVTDNIPPDAAESESGLFLDQLEGIDLKLAQSAEDCEQGNLWEILAKSRDNAIKDFRSDLQTALLQKYKQKRQPFAGQIGSIKYKNNLTINNTFAGVSIYCDEILGGTMEIKKIGVMFDQSAPIQIDVYSNDTNNLVATITGNTVANQLAWITLANPLELEMSNNSGENPRYYFIYTIGVPKPKDIQAGCGCSNKVYHYYWNTKNPKYVSYEKDRWSEFVMITGTQGNDIGDRENWATSQYLNGLVFDVAFKCRLKDLICTDTPDYENNPLALVMAYAVRYKAGQILIDKILASGNINRHTMMDRERLMGKKNTYVKEYLSRVDYLTEEINYKANDCLICDDTDFVFKSGILS